MYVHHLGLYCILFRKFLISKYSFAVDKVMIKESYYYYYYKCRITFSLHADHMTET